MDDRSCDAFDHIPDEIWLGDNSHQEPVEGDGGLVFSPLKADSIGELDQVELEQ